MDQLTNSAQLTEVVSHVTKVIEAQVDQQIERIDSDISHLNDEDELKALRQKRLQTMKKSEQQKGRFPFLVRCGQMLDPCTRGHQHLLNIKKVTSCKTISNIVGTPKDFGAPWCTNV